MAITAEELNVIVKAETRRARKELGRLDKRIDGIGKTTKATGVSLKKVFGGTAITAGAIALGRTVARVGSEMVMLAAAAEEIESKFAVVFGDMSREVAVWARRFGNDVGVATSDVQAFLATVQDTLVPLGFATGEAADMSTEVVKLARDLASFNNLPTEQVIRDIQSALVGNTETLRKYGIVATQSSIEQHALNRGIIATKNELTASKKALAIYQIAFEGSTAAVGDALRTQESFANQLVRLQSNVKELKEEIGLLLSEGIRPLLVGVNKAIEEWNLEGEILSATRAMGEGARDVDTLSLALQGQTSRVQVLRKEIRNLEDARTGEGFYIMDRRIQKLAGELAIQQEIAYSMRTKLDAAKLLAEKTTTERENQEAIAEAIAEGAREAEAMAAARRAEKEAREQAVNERFMSNRAQVLAILKSEQTELERLEEQYEYLADESNAWAEGGMLEKDRQRALQILLEKIEAIESSMEGAAEASEEFFDLGKEKTLIENAARFNTEIDNATGVLIGQTIPAIEDASEGMKDFGDEVEAVKIDVEKLAASIIDDLGSALRSGDVSGLAEDLGSTIGGAIGMIAGGPIGAAIGSQLGALWGQTMGQAFETPEYIKAEEEALLGMGSSLASIIASGRPFKEFGEALDQQMREMIVQMAINAYALEDDLEKLGRTIGKALRDGVIDEQEQADIDALIHKIEYKGQRIQSEVGGIYEQLDIAPPSSADTAPQAQPTPYIGPTQTAGAPARIVNYNVHVEGNVQREEELTDSVFADAHRRGIA